MVKTIAVLATLDTKGDEAEFIREQLQALGSRALLVDIGVIGELHGRADVGREQVAELGGKSLAELTRDPNREVATPVMARGATRFLSDAIAEDRVHGVIGLGGLQGTALCSEVMRALPYGFPKLIVSTVASGDVSSYVDIKDITMMFSVSDILGLNAFTRTILARAAGAVHGMAAVDIAPVAKSDRPTIGMTNLGVLTKGAQHALERFAERGYEVVVFHAVGSGGRAMEQLMREGIIGAVFDYALGEIADELYGGLRAGGPHRLTVASGLGLPQVVCPGGAEHLGILVGTPHQVPDAWKDHAYVWHNPVVFVPRLGADELRRVAQEVARRLGEPQGPTVFMIPTGGTGSYAKQGGPLRDVEADRAFFEELKACLPKSIEIVERPTDAEDPVFVDECVDRLIGMLE